MATLREAEAARTQNEDLLERLGAYALEIQPVSAGLGYELIAHFPVEPPATLPTTVVARVAGVQTEVPLRARRGEAKIS